MNQDRPLLPKKDTPPKKAAKKGRRDSVTRPSSASSEAKKDPRKSSRLVQNSSASVVLLICAVAVYTGRNFYYMAYPTFPEYDHAGLKYKTYGNRINPGTLLNLKVYLTEKLDLTKQKPIWEMDFPYDWDTFRSEDTTVPISIGQKVLDTGRSLDVIGVISENGKVLTHSKASAIKYINPPSAIPTYNLVSNSECPAHQEKKYGKKKQLARGIPKMQLRFVDDKSEYPTLWGVNAPYMPPLFVDEFWLTDDQLVKMNATGTNTFDLLLHFDLMSSGRWHFQREMSHRLTNLAKSFGEDSEEILQMRDLFANTSAWLLILTFVVSFLHMIFEYLAFKNDVIFWKNQSAEDLNKYVSVQSVLVGIIFQILLLLYLWDESANFLVLLTSVASIVIDMWKVSRALSPKLSWFKMIPYPSFVTRGKRQKVDNFDSQAMKFLCVFISPALLVYAGYSLTQDCHKGWYSYVMSTCASCVYSLGFILMTPQLFINYKYKTVQFLPWRRFIYRAINTFIDDLFSFIIRMPTMHRLSCFRDDIVFVIYLYQRWIYPVDKARLFDEDGYEIDDETKKKK